MPNDRFYIEKELSQNSEITLEGEEHHHLFHVMRIKPHEEIEIINGKGTLATAIVETTSKKQSLLRIISSKTLPKDPITHTLAIGLPRFNRLEYIVEKTVELGVDKLIFFAADGSEKSELSTNQWERIKHLSVSAIKQCGRLYLPEIALFSNLQDCKILGKTFFGDTKESSPCSKEISKNENCTFFIGPEKGFSDKEIDYLKNKIKALGVSLNPNILRVDTAAIAAAVFLSDLKMNRSPWTPG